MNQITYELEFRLLTREDIQPLLIKANKKHTALTERHLNDWVSKYSSETIAEKHSVEATIMLYEDSNEHHNLELFILQVCKGHIIGLMYLILNMDTYFVSQDYMNAVMLPCDRYKVIKKQEAFSFYKSTTINILKMFGQYLSSIISAIYPSQFVLIYHADRDRSTIFHSSIPEKSITDKEIVYHISSRLYK